jgi:hypothetical protein
MAASDAELFHQIGELLWPQSGWSLEPSPSPGGPASWCYEHHGQVTASVTVQGAVITLYLDSTDVDLAFSSVAELIAWLDANQGTDSLR